MYNLYVHLGKSQGSAQWKTKLGTNTLTQTHNSNDHVSHTYKTYELNKYLLLFKKRCLHVIASKLRSLLELEVTTPGGLVGSARCPRASLEYCCFGSSSSNHLVWIWFSPRWIILHLSRLTKPARPRRRHTQNQVFSGCCQRVICCVLRSTHSTGFDRVLLMPVATYSEMLQG